jgi:hypothetical protein
MGNQQTTILLKPRKPKYGCIPDIPDQRDVYTTFPSDYYPSISLDSFPPVEDQQSMSVENAVIAYHYYNNKNNGTELPRLSAQFIKYNQSLVSQQQSSSIRDCLKVLERVGVCDYELCPTSPDSYKPSEEAYRNASTNKQIIQYRRLRIGPEDFMKSLSLKIPILLGFTAYDSFEHPDLAKTGIMTVPKQGEKIVGYGSTLLVGYSLKDKSFLCRYSKGPSWGQKGHFWMPFSYLRNCRDAWIMASGHVKKIPLPGSAPPAPAPVQAPKTPPVQAPKTPTPTPPVLMAIDKYPLMRPVKLVEKIPPESEYQFKNDTTDDADDADDEYKDYETVV